MSKFKKLYWIAAIDVDDPSCKPWSWDNPIPGPPYDTRGEAEAAGREKWPGSSFRIYSTAVDHGFDAPDRVQELDEQLAEALLGYGGFHCSDPEYGIESWVMRQPKEDRVPKAWTPTSEALKLAGYRAEPDRLDRELRIPVDRELIEEARAAVIDVIRRRTPNSDLRRAVARLEVTIAGQPLSETYGFVWELDTGEYSELARVRVESRDDAVQLIRLLRAARVHFRVERRLGSMGWVEIDPLTMAPKAESDT